MTSILIVDDEHLAREKLSRLLLEINNEFEIVQASNAFEALEWLKHNAPDIAFFDIEMPSMNGMQLLQNIPDRKFKIIFQTAYDAYAVKAFEENACDYLLKPYTKERLEKALAKAIDVSKIKKFSFLEKISVKTGNKYKIINVSEIYYFSSKDHYTFINTIDNEYICDLSLTELEERIPPNAFLRVHRNSIINLALVKDFSLGEKAEVTLQNGTTLPVSRSKKNILAEKLRK